MFRLPQALTVGLLIGMLGLIASLTPFGLHLEEKIGLDLLFKLRGAREAPSDVVIVSMDKISADNLNLPTDPEKWSRSLHARLIEILFKEKATVIAFDIIFDEARSPEEDNLFAEAIRSAGNVVLCDCLKKETVSLRDEKGKHATYLNIERLTPPIPLLARSAAASASFPLPKVPVKVSQYWTFKTGAGDTPTLPVVVFQIFALDMYDEFIRLLKKASPSQADRLPQDKNSIITTKSIEKLIRLLRDIFENKPLIAEKMLRELQNSRTLPVDMKKNQTLKSLIRMYRGANSHYLNFYGPPGTVTTLPYYQLLHRHKKSAVDQHQPDLNGKAVFVGISERLRPEQKDGFNTVFSQSHGLDISGVEIAATAFANLLEDMHVQPFSFRTRLVTILLGGTLLGLFCLLFPPLIATASVIGLGALYLITVQYQFKSAGSWHPVVIPLMFQAPVAFFGSIMWKYFHTNKERQNMRKAFGYYLPDKVVDQLAKNMKDIKASSQIVYGACLFTDAEQYTALAEPMDPEELCTFMNKYYEAVFEPVRRYGGIVSDVKGDSILAIWATPHPDAAHRNNACFAALDIASAVHKFNQASHTLQLPTRIGLHSGYMFLGNVGAINHYEYRPVGDIVNTASRIEELNKYLGTQKLVSEDVLYQLDGFLTRELGKFLLVGKSKPVVVHELVCRMQASSEQQRSFCAIFAEALSAYRTQSWEKAIERFYKAMKIIKEDGPSIFYLELCKKYRENPPGEIWDGLVHLNKK